jgi:hypothetical protein
MFSPKFPMNITVAKMQSLDIAILNKTEKQVTTPALEVAVMGKTCLMTIGWAIGTVHIMEGIAMCFQNP